MRRERKPAAHVLMRASRIWLIALGFAFGNAAPSHSAEAPLVAEPPALASALDPNGTTEVPPVAPMVKTLLFGDLHVHSAWSLDAYASGVIASPRDAWRYARGETIRHVNGREIRLSGPPLDFMALTEHAEYLGVPQAAGDPDHVLRKQPLIETWATDETELRRLAWKRIEDSFNMRIGLPALMQDAVIAPAWKQLVDLADSQNEPGRFSAIVGFEYTSDPGGRNLHRNVIFRGGAAPTRPFSAMDSLNPEDLWRWMDAARAAGHDALSIPHNANGSDGGMFALTRFDGSPLDSDWIALRSRNEPSMEVFQIKGASESHPALSPDDPWAGFEIIGFRTTRPDRLSRPEGSYLRDALKRGLDLERTLGGNPYRLGVLASTDGHNAASPFEENDFTGKLGHVDGDAVERLLPVREPGTGEPTARIVTRWGAAGLAGVWATSNTREAIFDAIRRRETFGTSGTRIRVRLAAGWALPADASDDPAQALEAAPNAFPMGGSLDAPPHPDATLGLVFSAQRDPLSGPLERVQVIKGWIDEAGKTQERVFDVACAGGGVPDPETHRCPASAPPPDLGTCEWSEASGSGELSGRFEDPNAAAGESAFYYVRVLEVPTCRWSTHEANRLGRPRPIGVPASIQERAVTSPVWTR